MKIPFLLNVKYITNSSPEQTATNLKANEKLQSHGGFFIEVYQA